MKTKNLIVISLLSLVLGFLASNIIIESLNVSLDSDPTLLNSIENPGVLFFFRHNLSFFLTMTVLPIINIPIFIFQLIITGIHINIIGELALVDQFNILYRHLFFEFTAMLTAVILSYKNYRILVDLHRNRTGNLLADLKQIIILYIVVTFLTIFAALLEGNF